MTAEFNVNDSNTNATIQWIPGHIEISRNTKEADTLAKEVTDIEISTPHIILIQYAIKLVYNDKILKY